MTRQYITTAIDYPNAAPHMGHVLEKVLADVCARWFRLRGDEVRFQIGTDEHGIKIQRTAEKEGLSPKALVDRNVPLFQSLYDQLGISYDEFIRTSDQKKHWPTVIELWKNILKAGMLEKKSYSGLYCSGCERFMTKRDLVDGKCPIHHTAPEEVKEENWFFLLSKDTENLQKLLTTEWEKEKYRIVPEFRAQETLSLIDQGLEDVSFSRPKTSLSWGVPVPDDEEQTMYVWCDALTNYISGLDYFGLAESGVARHAKPSSKRANAPLRSPSSAGHTSLGEVWWDEATVTHVIGKDIARFHALYWPAMLHHAGVRAPDQLLIHGFLTSEGEKMSKSIGNVVVPSEVIEKYGVDPLRFYLSHEVPVGNDGDFSWERIQKLYDSKLRNDIGNLLNRVLVLIRKENGELLPLKGKNELVEDSWAKYEMDMNAFDLSHAIQHPLLLAATGNQYIDLKKVWTLKGEEKMNELSILIEYLRHIALMLLPFTPETSQKMSNQLGLTYAKEMTERDFVIGDKKKWGSQAGWKHVGEPEILFAPIE